MYLGVCVAGKGLGGVSSWDVRFSSAADQEGWAKAFHEVGAVFPYVPS